MADFGYSPQEGVTFYYDNRGKVTDLCINPNVKTVTICSRSSNSFVGSQFSLQDCKKQFPDVEVLRISSDIIDVCINNKMFPNVKNVYSESKYYKNDVRMLVHKYKNGSFALKNAFCAAAGDVIDLKGISIIDDNAFDGCMATDFVNIDDVSICRADAFTGSAIELNKRYKNGLQIFGSVLIGVQSGVYELDEILSNFSCTIKDEQYYLDCYKSCPDLILVQETAIALALITGNENIKKELKKRARSITSRLLKSNQEEKLVDFLKLDLLSDRMLASLQETAQENGMTTVSAYILNEQNKKLLKKESSKSTFRI